MITPPQIVQSEAQLTAFIHVEIPREQMPLVMGPAIEELLGAIAAQQATPAGCLYTYHRSPPGERFDVEVGFPVSKPIAPAGRVQPGQLPAMQVARTFHQGGYEGLGAAWSEFMDWIARNGHSAGPTLWERYLRGPESGEPAEAWQTELNRPV